ncbi:hypothetical protein HQQ94_20810 [Shewanella sp. VB17]|uniref:hypothetical protein n=1 Tax=Shewanella sp. VB17 TaxID=2739432 RepID=UPI001567250E|nr:hypothetical protein [Shewanella sp. VB17]NRD75616.1 hypothetical protein [Shewanella sp. VB17]
MKKPTLPLSIIMILYAIMTAVATWRAINIQAVDLFSLGVVPVLLGLMLRTSWASIAFKAYLAIQTLGLTALAGTAIIAYQISPQDVKIAFNNQEIPVPLVAIAATILLVFQYWVAFSKSTKVYLEHTTVKSRI